MRLGLLALCMGFLDGAPRAAAREDRPFRPVTTQAIRKKPATQAAPIPAPSLDSLASRTKDSAATRDSAAALALRADSVKSADSTGAARMDTVAKADAEPREAGFEVYEIQDAKLVQQLWALAGREGESEPGRYQVLLVSDSLPRAWLMHEGTQAGSLPPEKMAWVRQRIKSGIALKDDGLSRTLSAGFWGNFWNPTDWAEPYQWKTGMEFSFRETGAVFRKTSPLLEQQYDLVFSQRPAFWLTTELGTHFARQSGGLRRNLFNPDDSRSDFEPWGRYIPWWHAAIGVPGIKWEVALANRVFPEYYWLDPHAGTGSYKLGMQRAGLLLDSAGKFPDGSVMRNWNGNGKNPKPSPTNVAHTLHLKAGHFRYQAHFDEDMYRSTIHQLLFDELYAPFGQWAVGFVTAGGAAHTRLRLDLFPWHTGVGPSSYGARARVYFLRINLDYRDASTYHVGLSTSILFDGPFLRPGETP